MAHPRRITRGETYLITRRCYQRTFRLRPSVETNRIFMYCLAHALRKTDVILHAACVMSNHHHLVVTDVEGKLPDFLRELHRLTAKPHNPTQGQWENLWSAEPCNAVRLVTDEDILDKIVYVVANPVASGLVARPEEWPGFIMWGQRSVRVDRPTAYFRENGVCESELELEVQPPVMRGAFIGRAAEWAATLLQEVENKVCEHAERLEEQGRHVLGDVAVLAASFVQRAESYEEKRGVVPTLASKVVEVRDALRKVERAFRARYRAVLAQWRKGARTIAFPFGTWWMRVLHGADVEPAPASPNAATASAMG
jgi:REP element-mobilizing transposase RayT